VRGAELAASSNSSVTVLIAVLSFVVICQVYRYWKVSTGRERLQAKWVILPLGVLVAQILVLFVLSNRSSNSAMRGLDGRSCLWFPPPFCFRSGWRLPFSNIGFTTSERIVSVSYGLYNRPSPKYAALFPRRRCGPPGKRGGP
jgi:hypothetical protein